MFNHKNDILNGSCSTYFRGRKPNIFCNYINNKLDGEYIVYNKYGAVLKIMNFKDGYKNGEETDFFLNGVIKSECIFS